MEKLKNEAEPEEAQQKQEPVDEEDETETEAALSFDTTEKFEQVFGDQVEFDSWDEFTTCLDAFSKITGFYFKPRSACTIEYLNEKRITSPIPERFVYAKVKMICVHYGDPPRADNGHTPRKGFNYVGKGCEAYFQVSHNKGALRIGKRNLVHKNHSPRSEDDGAPLRQFRAFNFSEELDILIAREVLKNNPFELPNGEKRWTQTVEVLKAEDERLANLTPRLVKKRIRFLIDKFIAISHGRMPVDEDEMGQILYELNRSKRERLDNPPGRGRKRKRPTTTNFKPTRYKRFTFPERDETDTGGLSEAEEEGATVSQSKKRRRSPSPPRPSSSNAELTAFLAYLRNKDEEDRRLREQELELNKEELAFRKREMDFLKQKFEFEKFERKAHLDLLKAQLVVLEKNTANIKHEVVGKELEQQPVEYTIVLDGNAHHPTVVS